MNDVTAQLILLLRTRELRLITETQFINAVKIVRKMKEYSLHSLNFLKHPLTEDADNTCICEQRILILLKGYL